MSNFSPSIWEDIPENILAPKNHMKSFPGAPRAIKHQLTCPIELTSGSFLIGKRDILVITRNRLVSLLFHWFVIIKYIWIMAMGWDWSKIDGTSCVAYVFLSFCFARWTKRIVFAMYRADCEGKLLVRNCLKNLWKWSLQIISQRDLRYRLNKIKRLSPNSSHFNYIILKINYYYNSPVSSWKKFLYITG